MQISLALLLLVALLLALVCTRPGAVVVRTLLRPVVRAVYAFRVEGSEHVPRRGGALLVANHVSYADAFLLGACLERPVRFLMHRSFFANPLVGAFARWVGTIPVASGETAEERERALSVAADALRRGELVAIFAEGRITRTGALLGFRRGLETIARQAGAPIVPAALDEVWGSVFSFAGGRALARWPRRLPYSVRVSFGAPLPPDTAAHRVRDAIGELLARSAERRALEEPDLARSFVRAARRHGARTAVLEGTGARRSYSEMLAATLALGRELRAVLGDAPRVGVLLPPGLAAVELHVALALEGRVAVALDPGLGCEGSAALATRAGLTHVVADAAFAARLGWTDRAWSGTATVLDVGGLRASAVRTHGNHACRLARLPAAWLERLLPGLPRAADAVAVLATGGTAGAPRAVVTTHANVASNVRALAQVGELGECDVVLGALPFSHAYGHTVTLWAPLLTGACLLLVDGPTDPTALGRAVRLARPSVLVATPALYAAWTDLLDPDDLGVPRLAISGGEHLPHVCVAAWSERFGGELHEGYGATELGPVVSVDLPDVRRGGLVQRNHQPGTVGRSLPGVHVRVVREGDGALCDPDEEGRVLVRGPGRSPGYLDDPEVTAAFVRDGWYDTGDVGALDRDGFLSLVDRRERFSELGGRLVAHARVEDALRAGLGGRPVPLAVVAVGGAGSLRLGVVHERLDVPVARLLEAARAAGLHAEALPREEDWVEVERVPLASSGKVDLRALERVATRAAPAR